MSDIALQHRARVFAPECSDQSLIQRKRNLQPLGLLYVCSILKDRSMPFPLPFRQCRQTTRRATISWR